MNIRAQVKDWMHWDALPYEERHARVARYMPALKVAARTAGFLHLSMKVIALLSLTDKVGAHEYVDVYSKVFRRFRNKPITLLEVGVGGYAHELGGRSLTLWNAYFQRARIAALDILDKTSLTHGRVKVFQCSQTDAPALKKICDAYGGFDIIIDDGSHINELTIETFNILFDHVRAGGLYVIEDLQTSYDDKYGGGPLGSAAHGQSAIAYFGGMVDAVNAQRPSNGAGAACDEAYPSKCIDSIQFFQNLCVIQKRK